MFIRQTDINDETCTKCVSICKYFHTTVQSASDRFYDEQQRRTYVTPTSYLELIQTFKNLYYMKVDQITMQRNRSVTQRTHFLLFCARWIFRYETGLEKLDFAAGQIGLMQDELTALQPQLRVASAVTEKLMVKIEQDTVIVEKKKEVKLTKPEVLSYSSKTLFLDCRRRRGVGKRSRCRSASYQRWLRVGFGRSHSGFRGGFGCTEYFDTAGYNFGEVHEESAFRRQTCYGSRKYIKLTICICYYIIRLG